MIIFGGGLLGQHDVPGGFAPTKGFPFLPGFVFEVGLLDLQICVGLLAAVQVGGLGLLDVFVD